MRKFFMFFSCLCILVITTGDIMAQQNAAKIKDIRIENGESTAKVVFETEGEPKIIAYDIVKPPQIIIDVIGNGTTNVAENIPVQFGAIKQIKVIKTDSVDENYYGVDFWVVELESPLEYKFSSQGGTYVLTLAKAKAVALDKISLASKTEDISTSKVDEGTGENEEPKVLAGKLRQQGYQYQMEGNYDRAVEYYKKAIAEDPFCTAAYNDLGVMYYIYLNEVDKAIEALKKALSIDKNYAGAYTNLALICEKTGSKEEALKYWTERARLGNPEDYWTKTAKGKIEKLNETPSSKSE